MKLREVVGEQRHEGRDATQDASLLLGGVVHVAEVLEVGCCIGLHHIVGVAQEVDYLVQVWIPPSHCTRGKERGVNCDLDGLLMSR